MKAVVTFLCFVVAGLVFHAATAPEPMGLCGPVGPIGPQGERGPAGQDCNCAGLRAEAENYVATNETKLAALAKRIKELEAAQCKCRCK